VILFNCIGCVALNDKIVLIDESERKWKKLVMAYFKLLFHHLPIGTEENNKIPELE
jgi:hypothetical protein